MDFDQLKIDSAFYNIHHFEADKMLALKVTGKHSLEELKAIWYEFINTAIEKKIGKWVIDQSEFEYLDGSFVKWWLYEFYPKAKKASDFLGNRYVGVIMSDDIAKEMTIKNVVDQQQTDANKAANGIVLKHFMKRNQGLDWVRNIA